MSRPLRVGGYARVSHEEQKRFGFSVSAQADKIRKWCEEKGHHLVDLYIDEGFTAGNMKRPRLQEMLENLDDLDIIAFTRLDRFSRNVLEANRMLEMLQLKNVALISIEEDDIDTMSADGMFMFQLKVSLAERELKKGSERIRSVFDYKVKEGHVISGSTPPGYMVATIDGVKRMVKDPAEAPWVIATFDHYATHQSIYSTMIHMNEQFGHLRSYQVYNRLLKNPIYTGAHRGNPTFTEPYITKERFDLNQELLARNVRVRKSNSVFLFTGLIFCPLCGSPCAGMYKKDANYGYEYHYYRCQKRHTQRRCDFSRSFNEATVEAWLLDNVERLMAEYMVDVARVQLTDPDVSARRIKAIKEEIENLNYIFLKGRISADRYDRLCEDLEQELARLNAKSSPVRDTAALQALLSSGWRSTYEQLSRERKRSFWRGLLRRIVSDPNMNLSVEFMI